MAQISFAALAETGAADAEPLCPVIACAVPGCAPADLHGVAGDGARILTN